MFCCPVSGAVDFLLSGSYFFWVVWNLVYQGQLVSWRASRPLFGPHGENFDFSTIVRDFVTVERYADAFASPCRVCWNFFRHLLELQLTWWLEFGVHRCGCLGVDVQSDSAEVHYVRPSCLWENVRLYGESAGPCVEERWWPIIFGSASSSKTMPCCNDVLPSIRQSTWSTVEKKIISFRCSSGKRTCSASVVDTRTQAHLSLTQHLHVHRPAVAPRHVARGRNNDEKTSSPCTCFSLLFFLLSDFEMLKNIVFKFLLLVFFF